MMDCALRGAQGDVQDGSFLRHIDLFAPKHGVDPRSQAGFLGQLQEQLEGFVGDAILGVIQVKAHGLGGQPLAAAGIVSKELPEMQLPDLLIVGFQGLPGRRSVSGALPRSCSCSFRSPRWSL